MNARETYKQASRAIRASRTPANSGKAWRIIAESFNVPTNPTPWGSDALRVQELLQRNSYPESSLHFSLAHSVLNFPSLIRDHNRARRASVLAARLRMAGKLQILPGNYAALPGDDSERRRDEWRARGEECS